MVSSPLHLRSKFWSSTCGHNILSLRTWQTIRDAISHPTHDSPPLGIVKLGFWKNLARKHDIGFYAKANEENVGTSDSEMEWVKMLRVNKLNFYKFEFEYNGRSYIWNTLRAGYQGDRPDLELREKVTGGAGETLLAFYKGERRNGKMKAGRGVFYLRGKSWSEARISAV
jgi:hypothetical protein